MYALIAINKGRAVKWVVILLVLTGIGGGLAFAARPAMTYWRNRNKPEFRTTKVAEGEISFLVNSTGNVKPVLEVQIGAVVSGPITKLHVDFNDFVEEGQLLAEIDPQLFETAVARDRAILATRKADVERVEAQLKQARNDEQRSKRLRERNEDFISDTEMDQFLYARMSLEAQLKVAVASVEQAEASMENSLTNLGYTKIKSPVAGVVIDRKIDPGQSLAAQFQAPELFVVAPKMKEEMHIFASVDEADIGLIREAQEREQPVFFTVDAYPKKLFEGDIHQVRFSSTTEQNVVTYPVVVSVANPDLELLPGMTASLSFQIEKKADVVRIPNAALRYYPEPRLVRPEDQKLFETRDIEIDEDEEASAIDQTTEKEKNEIRHVWVKGEGDLLQAIEVTTGISDSRYTEMVTGDLTVGQELVIGVKGR